MRKPLLLTDLDNTWFNWVDFFGPALRAMVHAFSRTIGCPEEMVYDQLRDLYRDYGTLEYKRALQELPVFSETNEEVRDRALNAGVVAFGRSRGKRLRMYEQGKETLTWLVTHGVLVVAVTNSPLQETLARFQQLGITGHFSGAVGWRGAEELQDLLDRATSRAKEVFKLDWVLPLAHEDLKPSPVGYELALERVRKTHEVDSIWVLGDSPLKDLEPAVALGAKTIWARYGRDFDERNFETLLRVTHWSPERIESTYAMDEFPADFTIDSISELRSIVPVAQQSLF